MKTVLFLDGTIGRHEVFAYSGGCLVGQSTAYVIRSGQMTWVKPGESVDWIESKS